jgi:hypothetical protein
MIHQVDRTWEKDSPERLTHDPAESAIPDCSWCEVDIGSKPVHMVVFVKPGDYHPESGIYASGSWTGLESERRKRPKLCSIQRRRRRVHVLVEVKAMADPGR